MSKKLTAHLAVTRCSTFRQWPNNIRISRPNIDIKLDSGILVSQAEIVSYDPPESSNQNSKTESEHLPLPIRIFEFPSEEGYWIGNKLYIDKQVTIDLNSSFNFARKGDVDFVLLFWIPEDLSFSIAESQIRSISLGFIQFFNSRNKDLIHPRVDTSIYKLKQIGSQAIGRFTAVSIKRDSLDIQSIEDTIDEYLDLRSSINPSLGKQIDTSCRRYVSSLSEQDLTDEFLDLWETCEFASIGVKSKGDKASKVAQALYNHIKLSNSSFERSKSYVENTTRIRSIYRTRGKLVHLAEDVSDTFDDDLKMLRLIASELIRWRLGLSYSGSLDDELASSGV